MIANLHIPSQSSVTTVPDEKQRDRAPSPLAINVGRVVLVGVQVEVDSSTTKNKNDVVVCSVPSFIMHFLEGQHFEH